MEIKIDLDKEKTRIESDKKHIYIINIKKIKMPTWKELDERKRYYAKRGYF